MNTQQFEEFLHSIGGLHNAFKKGDIITSAGFFAFNEGWYKITADLIIDLIALGWDKEIAQAKEKFGAGRFYIGDETPEMGDRIAQWEDLTWKTCEVCGTTEQVVHTNNYRLTICRPCHSSTNCKHPIREDLPNK